MQNNSEYSKVFDNICDNNLWGGESSKSGPGSDCINTQHIIREIPFILKKFDIETVLDIACGDFAWFKKIELPSTVKYIGADIVQSLVDSNNARYKSDNIQFINLDVLSSPIPKADLIICRDCFIHFPNQYIKKAIVNIKRSKSRYLLTTSHNWRGVESNLDIKFGEWRRINLELSPFNFPTPDHLIYEGSTRPADIDRFLCLWEISRLI